MTLPQHTRRPAFDEIANGWGGDKALDLEARIALVVEFERESGELTNAESKVLTAMRNRVVSMAEAAER